jgi:hypothetical protein
MYENLIVCEIKNRFWLTLIFYVVVVVVDVLVIRIIALAATLGVMTGILGFVFLLIAACSM